MSDSEKFDRLAEKRDRNKQARLDAVRRWAEYVDAEPADVWGPQQNAVVDAQLESAAQAGHDADHYERIRAFAQAESARQDGQE